MRNILLFTHLFAIVAFSQMISLHGIVKDKEGAPVADATVQLEETAMSTTTADDGSFTLSASIGTITPQKNGKRSSFEHLSLKNGNLTFRIQRKIAIEASVYTLSGRRLSTLNAVYPPGIHRISLLPKSKSNGMYLIRICTDTESRIFTSTFSGCGMINSTAGTRLSKSPHRRANTALPQKVVIAFTKKGYLNYRMDAVTDEAGTIWETRFPHVQELTDNDGNVYHIIQEDGETRVVNNFPEMLYAASSIEITLHPNAGDLVDIDGNVYQTVRIGNQVWTAENWRSTRYNDGTAIVHVPDSSQWAWTEVDYATDTLNDGTVLIFGDTTGLGRSLERFPAYCFYKNSTDPAYQKKWGALYTWHAVNTGKLAPEGWRIPSEADWETLKNYLIANKYNCDGTTTGNKVAKSMRLKADWVRNSFEAEYVNHETKINSSGFSANPGGYRDNLGSFTGQNNYGYWWSEEEERLLVALMCSLSYKCDDLQSSNGYKREGRSVRLIRDN